MGGKKKITGIAFLIIGFSLFLVKTGFSVILLKPISKITGFAVLKIQSVNSIYPFSAGFLLIIIGLLLILFKKREEKEIEKFV